MSGKQEKNLKNLVCVGMVGLALAGWIKEAKAGFTEIRITSSEADEEYPDISGDRIVWSRDDWDYGRGGIYMWDPVNGTQEIYGGYSEWGPPRNPAISGDRVVWEDHRRGSDWGDIYTWDPVNGEQRVSWGGAGNSGADVSGDIIVWASYRYDSDIYMWDPINGEQPLITYLEDQMAPAISGDRIVWTDDRNGWHDIYMWDPVNGEEAVCTNPGSQIHPDISGDIIVWAVCTSSSIASPNPSRPTAQLWVGASRIFSGLEAFIWTQAGGMQGLDDLSDGYFNSCAHDVSDDGAIVVVGRGTVEEDESRKSDCEAFIWDEQNDIRSLKQVLEGYESGLTANWELFCARAISDDGSTIVGWGTHNDNMEAWIATIP